MRGVRKLGNDVRRNPRITELPLLTIRCLGLSTNPFQIKDRPPSSTLSPQAKTEAEAEAKAEAGVEARVVVAKFVVTVVVARVVVVGISLRRGKRLLSVSASGAHTSGLIVQVRTMQISA